MLTTKDTKNTKFEPIAFRTSVPFVIFVVNPAF